MAFRFFRDLIGKPNEFNSSEGKESQIMSRVLRGNTVTVRPTSSRFYTRGSDNTYRSGDVQMDQYSGGTRASKPSTAIESVKYDPATNICLISFRNGNGKQYAFKLTQAEFDTFLHSDSKGKYCNEVLKKNNRIPEYNNNGSGN